MSIELKKVIIYGKENCPYCTRAKQLTEQIQKNHPEVEMHYVDFISSGLTKEELTSLVKATSPVQTVPQVLFVMQNEEQKYIGGFTEYYAYVTKTDWL